MKVLLLMLALTTGNSFAVADSEPSPEQVYSDEMEWRGGEAEAIFKALYLLTDEYSVVETVTVEGSNGPQVVEVEKRITVGPIACDGDERVCKFMFFGKNEFREITVFDFMSFIMLEAVLSTTPGVEIVATTEEMSYPDMSLAKGKAQIECSKYIPAEELKNGSTETSEFLCYTVSEEN